MVDFKKGNAGAFRRAVGLSVDIGLFIPLVLFVFSSIDVIFHLIFNGTRDYLISTEVDSLFFGGLLFLLSWWWFDGNTLRRRGGSIGQRWMDLNVMRLDGSLPTIYQRLGRFFSRTIYVAPIFIAANFIQYDPAATWLEPMVHELLTGTRVIHNYSEDSSNAVA